MNTFSSGHRSRKCKEFSVKDAVRKSAAELMVLSLLCERTMYTYELNQLIRERSNGVLAFTTLYQATYKLKDLGYIEESKKVLSEDNRVRVYFSITQAGREALPIMMDEFHPRLRGYAARFVTDEEAVRDIIHERDGRS